MVFEKLCEILSEECHVDTSNITLETNLVDDLDVDSLDMYQLITVVEEEFDVEFLSEELENVKVVNDIVKLIKNYTDN